MTITQQAINKLDEGMKEKITDRYGNVIKTYVHNALAGFCRQNEAFAQAVMDGGTMPECIKHCVQGLHENTGISDIDIYRRAVQFYFPGAMVDFHISIVTEGAETRIHEEPERKTAETEQKTEKMKRNQPEMEQEAAEPEQTEAAAKPKPKKQPVPKQKKKEPDSNIIQLDLFM